MTQRTFVTAVGRFREGQTFDWPVETWRRVAESAKRPLDKISRATEAVVSDAFKGGRK